MSTPVTITFTSVAEVVGLATGIPGAQTLTLYDYSTELAAIDAEMTLISAALSAMSTEVGLISLELTKIITLLTAVQSPTGDFRTVSPEDISNTTLVTTALAKNIPPIVPAPGTTS